jgi:hypothetical protein
VKEARVFQDHYPALVAAYLVALAAWLLANRLLPRLWPRGEAVPFASPWKEFGFAILGAAGVLAVGQLWSHGIRLPERGPLAPVFGAINQVLIFAPMLLVPVLRRQEWTTAWLPFPRLGQRLLVGIALASLALTAYSFFRQGAAGPWTLLGRIWRYEHVGEMVQVFLEDVTIAILFVRLAAAIGSRWATLVVACLFAAAHVPVMLSQGATWSEIAGLLRDAGLGVAVVLVLQRSRDVVWFWCIHVCLDLTQFPNISGVQ